MKNGIQITVLTAVFLFAAASLFAGGSRSAQSSTQTVTTGQDGREKIGAAYTKGLPIADPGSYAFTLFVDDSKEDDNYAMFPIFEKETGVKVDLVKNPYAIANERLTLALNSGDYADSIGGWTLSQNHILTYGVEEKVFIPLEDIFAKYCPNITEALNRPGVRETMTAPDGHIYSIPYVLQAPLVAYQPWINTRWLKNVGMEIPKTTAEFEAVLKAFKSRDANGNGNPNDEIPFSGDPNNLHLGELCGWFGVSVRSGHNGTPTEEGLTMINGQISFGANTTQYRDGIKYLASLYAQGLIDPEIFTQNKEQWKAKGEADRYGVILTYHSQDIKPFNPGEVPEWVALPVLTGPGINKPVFLRDTYGTDILKNQVVITDKAKSPEAVARWWDFIFAYDNTMQTQHGPIGVTIFKEPDGKFRKIDITTMSASDQTLYNWGNLYPQSLPKYDPDGAYKVIEAVPMYDEKIPSDQLYEPFLIDRLPPYWASQEQSATLNDLQVGIGSYVRQKRAEWIAGQSNIDADWSSYLAQLDRLRLAEYLELRRSLK
jgi:putative aldouronate transport system substrate-binding protein